MNPATPNITGIPPPKPTAIAIVRCLDEDESCGGTGLMESAEFVELDGLVELTVSPGREGCGVDGLAVWAVESVVAALLGIS